ncbi:NHL repeat-containing protein [Bacillus dakarensis]|uniref:NHL repeat-containing protein n=1 Tax=Robertmurraya dakarensis TaxID=1926278 RepID=UPI0009809272|nr:NHL repeat-containing protein [Bacillus dakarensis]
MKRHDYLYIGDGFDNTVKTFDAESGRFLGRFVPSGDNGLNGPRGLIFDHNGNLLVTNQNVDPPPPPALQNGSILKYDEHTGQFQGFLVSPNDPNAPFAPRGIVLSKQNILFVADTIVQNGLNGEVRTYDGTTGVFLGNLEHPPAVEFFPRSVVIGPDGLLYVSVRNNPNTAEGQLGGRVVRYNPNTGEFIDVFIEGDSIPDFNRPEGLVFGPDGNLYITSFRRDSNDTDKILIFNRRGRLFDMIDLYSVGQPRAFAQAILFGPNGKLFVPITGPGPFVTEEPLGPDTGSVRRYNVKTKTFDVFVRPALQGGPLSEPWYLTFGKTDPATLAYGHNQKKNSDHDNHHDDDESSD